MGFGQVTELADARPHALAPDAAGTDGDEALGYLIADGLLVVLRVYPGPDAVFLVIMTKEIKSQDADNDCRKGPQADFLIRPVPVIEWDAAAKSMNADGTKSTIAVPASG